jgi:hypothetical protein
MTDTTIDVSKHLAHLIDYFGKYPDQFRKTVRDMITASDEQSFQALEYMQKIFSLETFRDVAQGFTDTEKVSWQSAVGKAKAIKDPEKVMAFIKERLLKSLIATGPLVDADSWELSLTLKNNDVIRFCKSYKAEGGMLLNILDSAFISRLIDSLPQNEAVALMEQAMNCEMRSAAEGIAFKKALKDFVAKSKNNSFPSMMFKALASIDPVKEKLVYRHLLQSFSTQDLVVAAAQNCPLDLLGYVSNGFYQEVLSAYPLNKKVRLLLCLDEDMKVRMIDASAPNGSSAREMLNMEMKQIEQNPSELKRCQMQRATSIQEFLTFVRGHLGNNPALQSEIKVAATEWLNSLKETPVAQQVARAA